MQLNEARIRAAKPADPGDGAQALYLRISPSGHKTFVLRSRHGTRARKVTLGTWTHLSLADARPRASAQKMPAYTCALSKPNSLEQRFAV